MAQAGQGLVDLRGVHGKRQRRRLVEAEVGHMILPGRRLGREANSPWHGRALPVVAAVEEAAHAGDGRSQHHRRSRHVRPAQQVDLALVAAVPTRQKPADEATVGHQASLVQQDDVERIGKLLPFGDGIKHARADDGPHRGPHVNGTRLLAGNAVLLGQPERQEPTHDHGCAQHHAVGEDGHGLPTVGKHAARGNPRAAAQPEQEPRAHEQVKRCRRARRLGVAPTCARVPQRRGHRQDQGQNEERLRREVHKRL